jgi:DNA-binding transcriptional MerR regulator
VSRVTGIRIGEVARRLGLTTRTLRYYEEMGLLAPEARSQGGFRSYGDDEIRRLERIAELKNLLGFNLVEIKQILGAEDELASLREEYFSDPEDSTRRAGILDRALELNGRLRTLVNTKMAGLEAMRTHLDERSRSYKKAKRGLRTAAQL